MVGSALACDKEGKRKQKEGNDEHAMRFKSNGSPAECTAEELESLVDLLEGISVRLREVLDLSKTLVLNETLELELRQLSILNDVATAEEAIDEMNEEISRLLVEIPV